MTSTASQSWVAPARRARAWPTASRGPATPWPSARARPRRPGPRRRRGRREAGRRRRRRRQRSRQRRRASGRDVVLLAVPYDGHDELVASLPAGSTARSSSPASTPWPSTSAAPTVRSSTPGRGRPPSRPSAIAPDARVVGAFHHVSAVTLWGEADVARPGGRAGLRRRRGGQGGRRSSWPAVDGPPGIDGGKLRLARQLEPLTAVLISINKRYKTHSGIRISGV